MRRFWMGMVLFAAVLVGTAFFAMYCYKTPVVMADTTVVIPPHTGTRAALAQLHAEGVLPPPLLVALPLVLSGQTYKLKAGEYAFTAGMKPSQVIDKLARGDVVIHKLTIPEGWNVFQVRELLENEPLLSGPLPPIEEGSIHPDTIHFTRGETRVGLVRKLQRTQEALLAALWPTRAPNLPLRTPQEALILASVIEKETGVAQERALVAGVFINRLRMGMALQTDPTVAYGVVVAQGGQPMTRPLSSADLRKDTAYNTYTRPGLPPTPICNPGRAALVAALHPAATDALYFVATGQGGHHFATTNAAHKKNVTAYRKALKATKK